MAIAILVIGASADRALAASAVAYNSQDGSWAYAQNEKTKENAERKALGALGAGAAIQYSSDSDLGWWSISVVKPNFLGAGNPGAIGVAHGYGTQIQASTAAKIDCENKISDRYKQKGVGCDYNVAYWKETIAAARQPATGCADLAANPISFDFTHALTAPGNVDLEGRWIVRAERGRVSIERSYKVFNEPVKQSDSCQIQPASLISLRSADGPNPAFISFNQVVCTSKYKNGLFAIPDITTGRRALAVLTEGRKCQPEN